MHIYLRYVGGRRSLISSFKYGIYMYIGHIMWMADANLTNQVSHIEINTLTHSLVHYLPCGYQ